MSAINLAHEIFVREMILHGDRLKAYKAAYPKASDHSAYKSACRLLSKPGIALRIWKAVQEAEEQISFALKMTYRDKIADTAAKRQELARIINREPVARTVTYYNKSYKVEEEPGIWEVLAAITLDSKLEHSWRRNW